MKRFLKIIIAGMLFLLVWVSSAQALIKIEVAEKQNGVTYIKGNGAVLGAQITWQGGLVTTANKKNGGFSFFGVLPDDCTGELSDGNETAVVQVLGCAPDPNPQVGADCTDPPIIGTGVDLYNCDLRRDNLPSADLSEADLSGADLVGAFLEVANLSNADLSNADLTAAWLRYANLGYADLSGAFLYKANLISASLESANLSNADLRYANLSGFAYLSNANLSNADLRYADLRYANLSGADLSGADLTGADIWEGVIWYNTTCPDGTNSDELDGDWGTCWNNL